MSGRLRSSKKMKQDYFQWLCELVHLDSGETPYYILMKELHSIEFTWSVPNDDNRAMDGINLRSEYSRDYTYFDGPCSVLEMLIALARRIDFELSSPDNSKDFTSKYFWELIDNLGLMDYNDSDYDDWNKQFPVRNIVYIFLQREYMSNGKGGLFPLRFPDGDQRGVELWYQMNAYLGENYN